MTIKRIDAARFKISLHQEDMYEFGFDYHNISPDSSTARLAVGKLLVRAGAITGISPSLSEVHYRIAPRQNGLEIYFTCLPGASVQTVLFEFESLDILVQACEGLRLNYAAMVVNSALYAKDGKYRLQMELKCGLDRSCVMFLREYGKRIAKRFERARTAEYWKLIEEGEAVQTVCAALV